MHKCKTLIYSLLIVFTASAQLNTDSLRRVAQAEPDLKKKAATLITLCEQLRFTEPDALLPASRTLYEVGLKLNDKHLQQQADYFSGTAYMIIGKPDSSYALAAQVIRELSVSRTDLVLLAKYYSLTGNSLMRLNRQKDALGEFYSSLQTAEAAKNAEQQFKARNNIGWAHMELEQFEKAIGNFKECFVIMKANGIPDKYGTIYNNLASCYGSLDQIDSVYKYAQSGIRIAEQNSDYAALANGYSILATFEAKEKKYADALKHFEKAVEVRGKSGDPFFIVSDLAEISELQSLTGNTTEGISNGEKALALARTNGIDAKLQLIYSALAHNYEQAGRFREATDMYKKMDALKDSLYNDASPKALAEIQTKYETVKKEQLIEKQQNRIQLQRYVFIASIVAFVLTGLLIWSLYRRRQLRKEARMQAELRTEQENAARAVLEAEEKERQRIARDLHDGVGQMMSAAKMNLSAFEAEAQLKDPEQQLSLEKIIGLVDDSCREVRSVSHTMMPDVLLKKGLDAALRDFTGKVGSGSLQIGLYTEGIDEDLPMNTAMILYRVLQEAVNNVIKHAQASRLDISVVRDAEGIHATIEDNGIGFDVTDPAYTEGMGLKNIRTRVSFLKGTVDVDSAKGRGTVIAVEIP